MSLKAAIAQSKPNRMKCSVALFKAKLSPAEQVELAAACATSVDELSHATLTRAIKAEWPNVEPVIQPGTLQRHRAGLCSCDA